MPPPAPKKGISRQARWERKVKNNPYCVRCGRKVTLLKRYCNYCGDLRNAERRLRYRRRKGALRKAGLLK